MRPMNKALLSRLAAVLVLCIPLNLLVMADEHKTLAQLNSDPAGYIAHRKEALAHLSGGVMFVVMFMLLAIAMLCVEALAYLLRGEWREGTSTAGDGSTFGPREPAGETTTAVTVKRRDKWIT